METTPVALNLADRIAQAMVQSDPEIKMHPASAERTFDPDVHVMFGELPASLRGLYNLRTEIWCELEAAKAEAEAAEEAFVGKITISNKSMDDVIQHVRMIPNWKFWNMIDGWSEVMDTHNRTKRKKLEFDLVSDLFSTVLSTHFPRVQNREENFVGTDVFPDWQVAGYRQPGTASLTLLETLKAAFGMDRM